MKCRIVLLIVLLILMSGCTDSLYLSDGTADKYGDLSAVPDDNALVEFKHSLYFGFRDEAYLVPELRKITQNVNETEIYSVMRELILGSTQEENKSLISRNTEVLGITTNNEYVYLSLSKHFLDVPAATGEWENDKASAALVHKQRRMAIYSIVNTLTELQGCTYVQLYIDLDSDGTAEKVTRGQVGFVGDGNENAYLDALSRNHNNILTPANTVRLVMDLIAKNQPQRLYNLVNAVDESGNALSYNDFVKICNLTNVVIGSFSVEAEVSVSNHGNSFVVLANYTVKSSGGHNTASYNDVPVNVLRKGNYYKVDMSFIKKVLKG